MDNGLLPMLRAGTRQLTDDISVIVVGDNAGESVGFGIDHATGVRRRLRREERRAARNRLRHQLRNISAIRHPFRIKGEHSDANLTRRRKAAIAEHFAFGAHDFNGFADARLAKSNRP